MKFNFTRGTKTKKGTKPPVTKIISKDHSIYPVFFNEMGLKRSEEEIKKNLEAIGALNNKQN